MNTITEQVPTNFRVVFPSYQIDEQILKTSNEILSWLAKANAQGKAPIVVSVLAGGSNYHDSLMKLLPVETSSALLKASTYTRGLESKSTGETKIEYLSHEISDGVSFDDKAILFVDDICDSGLTLKTLVDWAVGKGADPSCVKATVLVTRTSRENLYTPDWSVLTYQGEEWLVGRGMQYDGKYRYCKNIYVKE